MSLGLILTWIIGGGILSCLLRKPLRRWLLPRVERHWQATFILGATGMALLEEAVTTTMTNLAPVWGVSSVQAHITASGNYLDVVLLHSVIVFVPMFCAWAWLLSHYNFAPDTVFLLYGLTGTLAETGSFGAQNLVAAGFWVYVYGLMVFLPAYAMAPRGRGRRPGLGAIALAIILPLLAAIPIAIVVQTVHHTFFTSLP
jgi:hypothetical protein